MLGHTSHLSVIDVFYRDTAVMYEDSSFVVKGRKADSLRFKVFEDVYPGPIEAVVGRFPGVDEISVRFSAA